jgi:hypothetical protein
MKPTYRVVMAISAILIAGCHGKAERERCAAQVSELRTWMHDVAAEGYAAPGHSFSHNGKLVVVDEPHRADDFEPGPDLTLQGTQALLDETPAADTSKPAEVVDRMRSARRERNRMWEYTHPGKAPHEETSLVVLLSETDVWSSVALTLDAASRAGYSKATFVFDLRSRVPPPLDTPLSRELEKESREITSGEKIDPSRKARVLPLADGKQTPAQRRSVFGRCPEAVEAVGAQAGQAMSGEEKFSARATQVPDGIAKCSCNVDFDEVKASYWFMLGRYGGSPRAAYTVTIAPAGEPGVVEVAAHGADLWSSVYPRVIVATNQRISFVAN